MKRDTIFILLCLLALVFYIMKQMHMHVFLISNYGNDVLYIPLVCWLSEKMMQGVYAPSFTLGYFHVIANVVFAAIAFECVIPFVNKSYTADILDVFCYMVGGIGYAVCLLPGKKAELTPQDQLIGP
ncbi:MAG: hypothetical protein ACHQF2_08800 [Flavobacteriales bacterium]